MTTIWFWLYGVMILQRIAKVTHAWSYPTYGKDTLILTYIVGRCFELKIIIMWFYLLFVSQGLFLPNGSYIHHCRFQNRILMSNTSSAVCIESHDIQNAACKSISSMRGATNLEI